MAKKTVYNSVSLNLNTDDIKDAIDDNLDEAMFLGSQEILDVAKPKTPYKTGKLRNSGYISTGKRTSYVGGKGHRKEIKPKKRGEAAIAFSYFTARFHEFGTKHLPAHPFLRPAFDERQGNARDVAIDVLRQGLDKVE